MSRDSSFTYFHLHSSHHADLLEDFTRQSPATRNPTAASSSSAGRLLATEDIYVPLNHQPINPDEEDDVVPDGHAAFGIQRAKQNKEPAWRDLGLEALMNGGPPQGQAKAGAQLSGRATVVPFTGDKAGGPSR
ncbi:hypothetical protein LTR97_006635 [Elasticomyces elasticus]|uniref:Anaphase-promoting complex subunit 13 n=1 Tax=Elasticomyces elasticus TaxID=574655 RepID=A0AAN7VS34_9PEZI|nr:hypothetical protein LTR97_006635 [Elasticomyces elasticus]